MANSSPVLKNRIANCKAVITSLKENGHFINFAEADAIIDNPS